MIDRNFLLGNFRGLKLRNYKEHNYFHKRLDNLLEVIREGIKLETKIPIN